MQNFLVLGYVPGTDFQINFTMWLSAIMLGTLVWVALHEKHTIRAVILAWYVARLIKHHQLA